MYIFCYIILLPHVRLPVKYIPTATDLISHWIFEPSFKPQYSWLILQTHIGDTANRALFKTVR